MEPTEAGVLMQHVSGVFVTNRGHIRILRLASRPNPRIVEKTMETIDAIVRKARSSCVGQPPLRRNAYEPADETFCSRAVLNGFRDNGIDLLLGVNSAHVLPRHFESSPVLTDITARAVPRLNALGDM